MQDICAAMLLLFLAWEAYQDYRTKCLSVQWLLLGGAAGLLTRMLAFLLCEAQGTAGTGISSVCLDMAAGCGIGLAVLLLAAASQEAMGFGDGWLLVVTGLFLGWQKNLLLLLLSLCFSGVCSIILLLTGKKKQKDQIPFVPFVFGSYILLLC